MYSSIMKPIKQMFLCGPTQKIYSLFPWFLREFLKPLKFPESEVLVTGPFDHSAIEVTEGRAPREPQDRTGHQKHYRQND